MSRKLHLRHNYYDGWHYIIKVVINSIFIYFVIQQQYEVLEVCPKVLYQVELSRMSLDTLFGFSVEAELVENVEHQDELCVYVSRVEEGSQAHQQGKNF